MKLLLQLLQLMLLWWLLLVLLRWRRLMLLEMQLILRLLRCMLLILRHRIHVLRRSRRHKLLSSTIAVHATTTHAAACAAGIERLACVMSGTKLITAEDTCIFLALLVKRRR